MAPPPGAQLPPPPSSEAHPVQHLHVTDRQGNQGLERGPPAKVKEPRKLEHQEDAGPGSLDH